MNIVVSIGTLMNQCSRIVAVRLLMNALTIANLSAEVSKVSVRISTVASPGSAER